MIANRQKMLLLIIDKSRLFNTHSLVSYIVVICAIEWMVCKIKKTQLLL